MGARSSILAIGKGALYCRGITSSQPKAAATKAAGAGFTRSMSCRMWECHCGSGRIACHPRVGLSTVGRTSGLAAMFQGIRHGLGSIVSKPPSKASMA